MHCRTLFFRQGAFSQENYAGAPPHVIFPTYEDDNFNATSPPPLHEVEVTTINDNVDGASDDESGSNYGDDDYEDLDPSWLLTDNKNRSAMCTWGLMLKSSPFGWNALLKYQYLGVELLQVNS